MGESLAAAALLAACATRVAAPPTVPAGAPAEFPAAYYQGILARGAPVFRIDPARSLVVIVVRRGGSLTQFGHDHVIASHDVAGYIAPDEGRADLYVPLDALVVDEPALRSEIGLDTQPSPDDIAGTRRNMLEKVLETDRYPYATIAVSDRPASGGSQPLRVAIGLHGTTRTVEAPVQYRSAGEEVTRDGQPSDRPVAVRHRAVLNPRRRDRRAGSREHHVSGRRQSRPVSTDAS